MDEIVDVDHRNTRLNLFLIKCYPIRSNIYFGNHLCVLFVCVYTFFSPISTTLTSQFASIRKISEIFGRVGFISFRYGQLHDRTTARDHEQTPQHPKHVRHCTC
jgi:hypothetical protein